jgi:hypothetical protein
MINIKDVANKPHAIIFYSNGLFDINTYIKDYIKSIVNEDKKIDNLQYLDLL